MPVPRIFATIVDAIRRQDVPVALPRVDGGASDTSHVAVISLESSITQASCGFSRFGGKAKGVQAMSASANDERERCAILEVWGVGTGLRGRLMLFGGLIPRQPFIPHRAVLTVGTG